MTMYWKYITLLPLTLLASITPILASSTFSPNLTQRQETKAITDQIDLRIQTQPELVQSFFVVFQNLSKPQHIKNYSPYEQFIIQQVTSHILGTYISPMQRYDIDSDSSITKYVWVGTSYDNPLYIPDDLTLLWNQDNIYLFYGGSVSVSQQAYAPLLELAAAYRKHMWSKLIITSGYRSYQSQRDHFSKQCKDDRLCAHEGTSEHQSWLAIDFGGMSGDAYIWMSNNAHRYGFHQTYQKWIAIDGYQREDRHWRYVWVELATELYEEGLTFGERVLIERAQI